MEVARPGLCSDPGSHHHSPRNSSARRTLMPRGERRPARADCFWARELLSSVDPPDRSYGSYGLGNLGHFVNDLEQVSKLTGGRIRTDLDRVVDARRPPGSGVEPARRGHPDPFQLDSQRRSFPVEVIENAAGCREMKQMAAGKAGFHRDAAGESTSAGSQRQRPSLKSSSRHPPRPGSDYPSADPLRNVRSAALTGRLAQPAQFWSIPSHPIPATSSFAAGSARRSHAICARADWRDSGAQVRGLVTKAGPGGSTTDNRLRGAGP